MNTYSWLEIVLYVGFFQGMFLAFLLPRIAKANKEANKLLSLLLVTASFSVLIYLNTLVNPVLPIQTHGLLDTFPFLIGPMLYFYLQKLLFPSEKHKVRLVHFLPAFLHFCYSLSYFRYDKETLLSLFNSGSLKSEWAIIFSILMIVIAGYWMSSYKLLLLFKKQGQKAVLFKENLRFVAVLLTSVLLGYLVCIVFSLDFFFEVKMFSFTGKNLGWIVIPVLIYFISYFAIAQPDVLKVSFIEEKKSISRIGKEDMSLIKDKLEKVMVEEKIFLDPLLKLNDLAISIEIDSTRLSWLLNEEFGLNFYDFVNRYRIEEFLKRINNNDHKNQTLEYLAYDVGFNSKTTFNKSFKKVLDMTPSEYVRNFATSMSNKNKVNSAPIVK